MVPWAGLLIGKREAKERSIIDQRHLIDPTLTRENTKREIQEEIQDILSGMIPTLGY